MKKEMKYFKGENAGRSMTEMLGVLAIIGVLSLGGIIGYKLAMNRYAANQIAYEINMMKTDAKVKIAQGIPKLNLGNPYDGNAEYLGHLNYNENYFIDFDCLLEESDQSETCYNAKGYYFELSEIPEEICSPLANLLKNMSEVSDFHIYQGEMPNPLPSEEGICEEGNNNTLYIAFSSENLTGNMGEEEACGPSNCEGECTESGCVSCEEMNKHWDGNSCVSCTNGEWIGNQCVCPAEIPYWEETTGTCKTCYEVYGETAPKWDTETKSCIPCEGGTKWDTETNTCQEKKCRRNADCDSLEEYCYSEYGDGNLEFTNDDSFGKCHKINDDLPRDKQVKIDTITYYGSDKPMSWWSACRLCAARIGSNDSDCVSGQEKEPTFMLGYDDLQCADTINIGSYEGIYAAGGYCYGTHVGDKNMDEDNISAILSKLREVYGWTGLGYDTYNLWMRESAPSKDNLYNQAYIVVLDGEVKYDPRFYSSFYQFGHHTALCKD